VAGTATISAAAPETAKATRASVWEAIRAPSHRGRP
jgi:hypothetical protein